ncbi:MAG: hypothetical protein OXU42_02145 [Deltaproteobacteria bacterium]|nr:hypothetical protein [Deltaproteobacteria bacterium]
MTTKTKTVGLFGCISLFALTATWALAQHDHRMSPYAHTQSAEFATLTPDEVRELRNGDGMGLARAAELNSFPGPRHLLDLKADLDLTREQVVRIEAIHAKMKTSAVAKGEAILQAESHLANLFAAGRPTAAETTRMTEHLGIMRGQLQAIHLLAHIESTRELTAKQIERYDRLRGYRH